MKEYWASNIPSFQYSISISDIFRRTRSAEALGRQAVRKSGPKKGCIPSPMSEKVAFMNTNKSPKKVATMSAGSRNDPYGRFNFLVEIDGVGAASFTDVGGLTTETE